IRRINQRRTRWVQLRDERIDAVAVRTTQRRLQRKVAGGCISGEVSTPSGIHRDSVALIDGIATQISGIRECRAGRVGLRDKGILLRTLRRLERILGWKIRREGAPDNIRVAGGINSHGVSRVNTSAAEVSGVN